jgi:3'-phosphoadenosine 5'-phosphosulfate sulfotransferase (PAPS reductase)/FAD synthetase
MEVGMSRARFYLEDLKSKFNKINPNDFYLSYSGGKDSHLLYWFITEYAKIDGITIVGINTYMEHLEIMARMRKNCDVILKPALKPSEIKSKYGSPCFSKFQDEIIDRYQRGLRTKSVIDRVYNHHDGRNWSKFKLNKMARDLLISGQLPRISSKCCRELKKKPAHLYQKMTGKRPILGVMASESIIRATHYKSCFSGDKFTPLWDPTPEVEKEIYAEFNIELPKIYEKLERTGCVGCPYGKRNIKTAAQDIELELELLTPAQYNFVFDYFKEVYAILGVRRKRQEQQSEDVFKTYVAEMEKKPLGKHDEI